MASIKNQWPIGRGFERFYGFLGAETNQWYPDLVYDNHPVEQPYSPEEGYHLTTDLTDKALEFIRDAKAVAPDKPFFLYYAPGRLPCPPSRPQGVGRPVSRQVRHGLRGLPSSWCSTARRCWGSCRSTPSCRRINPYADERSPDGTKGWSELDLVRPWESLSDDEKRLFCRMAEVYAGFLSHADHEIGRLLDYLEQSGQLDNTMIVLVSDNGASGEGGPNGSVNENKIFNGLPDRIEENLPFLDELGGPRTYNHYPTGWACAFNTPFKLWKRYCQLGRWHRRPHDRLLARRHHRHRCVPAVHPRGGHRADHLREPGDRGRRKWSRATPSTRSKGSASPPPSPTSTPRPASRPSSTPWAAPRASGIRAGRRPTSPRPHPICGPTTPTCAGSCSTPRPTPPSATIWPPQHPDKLKELIALWWTQAGQYGALPLENRSVLEILTTERPQLAKNRNRYVYYPGCAEVPESVAPNIRNRSYTIAVEATIDSPDAAGVLFAQGSRFGGHALYIKDGKLKYVYNFVGSRRADGRVHRARPRRARGLLRLLREGRRQLCPPRGRSPCISARARSARAESRTQPGKFSIAGEGLNIGKEGGEPVTDDYPGQSPWAFVGGTIQRAIIDVSGEPFADLATEARAAFARD